jgi:hypothetical protein
MPVTQHRDCEVNFWPHPIVGRTQLGYRLLSPADDSVVVQARALKAVVNLPAGSQRYNADNVAFPYGIDDVIIEWDDPATGVTARELLDFRLDFSSTPGPGSPGTPSVGLGLVAALQARFYGTPELVGSLPGGIFFGPADEQADDNPPYASWIMNGGEVPWHDTGGMFGKRARFQMRLVGPDEDELRRIHEEVWEENFHPRMAPIAIANRVFKGLYDGPCFIDPAASLSPLGYNFVIRRWDFDVFTALNRVSA